MVRCCNDVMNDVDCFIKRDVYPQNVLKISVGYQFLFRGIHPKNRSWVILHGYSRT